MKKTFTIISIENKTDARVCSTVFMIDRNLFSVRFDFEGRVAVKVTVTRASHPEDVLLIRVLI